MAVRSNYLSAALNVHRRSGQLENGDQRCYLPSQIVVITRGTEGSNPSPSSGESGANSTLRFGDRRPLPQRIAKRGRQPHDVERFFYPGGGAPVTPGYDPIIGQAPNGGPRAMDEPFPNYPAGGRRTTLEMPNQFVILTAAAYFFMPSITALRTVLT
jgi:hypothetical protein